MSLEKSFAGASVVAPVDPLVAPAKRIHSATEALTVAAQLAAEFAEEALKRDQKRILPWAEVEKYSASGLWAISVPKAYGGIDAPVSVITQVFASIAASDGSLGHIPQNHFYAVEVIRNGGSEEQKRFFFERVLKGERLGNALAEIGHKDFKRRTQLIQNGDRWFVQGKKFYCTGALFAHWIPTLVSREENGVENQYLVIIPRTQKGITITDDWDGFGQRVTGSGSVEFDHVEVEPLWIIPFKTLFDHPSSVGPFAQILHAAIDNGIGHGALQQALPYIREKARPWIDSKVGSASEDPLTLSELGKAWAQLRGADVLIERAAQAVDAARIAATDDSVAYASIAVAQAKAQSTKASLLASNKLLELSGTASTLDGQGFDRFWRNARTHTLHDPVRWKYHAIGNYVLNAVSPPRHGAL